MQTIVDKLIEGRKIIEEADRSALIARQQEETDSLLAALRSHLGDFFVVLEEKGVQITRVKDHNDHITELRLSIPALDDYSLAPISVTWTRYSPGGRGGYDPFRISGHSYPDIASALKAAREKYPEYVEDRRKERIDFYNKETRYHQNPRKTEEEIRSIIDQLKAEFPDKTEQADRILVAWLRLRDEEAARDEAHRIEAEAEEAKRAHEETLRIKYVMELAEWLKARDAIEASNKELAEKIQGIADLSPYTVYKLTYAIVGRWSEEEETLDLEPTVETKYFYTLYSTADESGFWRKGLDETPIKVFNPVALEMMDVKASSGILAKHIEKAGIDFYFEPDTIDSIIPGILADIQELPEEPKHPQELGYLDDYTKRTYYLPRARALLEGKSEDEIDRNSIPF